MKSVPGFISSRQDFQKPTNERHRSRVELCKSAYPFFHGRLINSLLNEVHLKVNMPLSLKRITFKSIGYQAQPEPQQLKGSWQVFAPCEHADYSGCVLFSKIAGLSSIEDKKATILALKKLIQIAAMGQPITAHYDKKQCHELHKFKYQGKERVIWRIRHGDIRLPFYYGQGKLIFLASVLAKRKDKLSQAEELALEKEVKRYISAENEGQLQLEALSPGSSAAPRR
ncbi:hypothetical protein ATI45_4346 [Marinobacter sp. LV10MA510-1]|nr:hypothetical protein ATI45_4346 [Marinobacter sp. LV10MA510-1]